MMYFEKLDANKIGLKAVVSLLLRGFEAPDVSGTQGSCIAQSEWEIDDKPPWKLKKMQKMHPGAVADPLILPLDALNDSKDEIEDFKKAPSARRKSSVASNLPSDTSTVSEGGTTEKGAVAERRGSQASVLARTNDERRRRAADRLKKAQTRQQALTNLIMVR